MCLPQVYHDFHGFVAKAWAEVTGQCGEGLLFDIHGHSHAEMWVEFGYLLTASQLAASDEELQQYEAVSSIKSVSGRHSSQSQFAEVLRGKKSMGSLLAGKGYPSVPSPEFPDPDGGNYFSGGYITATHGSRDEGTVDAIQIESPRDVRFEENGRDREVYARHLAESILEFYELYYPEPARKFPFVFFLGPLFSFLVWS